jgi:hypothetical protein
LGRVEKLKTLNEKAVEEQFDQLKFAHHQLQKEYSDLKGKYEQLCTKLKTNANDTRNEGERFLSSYARDRAGPWS